MFLLHIKLDRVSFETKGRQNLQKTADFLIESIVFCPLVPPSWISPVDPTSAMYASAIYVSYIYGLSLAASKELSEIFTPPARRARRSFKFAPFLFFFSVSEVGAALMGDTAEHSLFEPNIYLRSISSRISHHRLTRDFLSCQTSHLFKHNSRILHNRACKLADI